MSAADARATADADSNDDGGAATDSAAAADGADDADSNDDGAAADSADDVLNDMICPMAAGHMYVSRSDQPCGQGAPPCRWRVSLALDGTFTWTHDGLVELGTYFCKGTEVTFVYVFRDHRRHHCVLRSQHRPTGLGQPPVRPRPVSGRRCSRVVWRPREKRPSRGPVARPGGTPPYQASCRRRWEGPRPR